MKSIFKAIKWLFVIALVLVVAVVGIAYALFDSDAIKTELAKRVKDKTQADLVIQQDLELKVFPWLKIETGGVSLSNPAGFKSDKTALDIGELAASLKIMPLFSGQLEVGAVTLKDANINLIDTANGKTNWQLIADSLKKSYKTEPESEQSDSSDSKFDLNKLSLSRLSLENINFNQYSARQKLKQSIQLKSFAINNFAFDQWTDLSASGVVKLSAEEGVADWSFDTQIKSSEDFAQVELKNTSLDGSLELAKSKTKVDWSVQTSLTAKDTFKTLSFAPIAGKGSIVDTASGARRNWTLNTEFTPSSDFKTFDVKVLKLSLDNVSDALDTVKLDGTSRVILGSVTKATYQGAVSLDKDKIDLNAQLGLGKVMDLNLDVKAGDVDLSPWLSSGDSSDTNASAAFDATPIRDFLKKSRIKGRLEMASLKVDEMSFTDLSANISNQGATLWLKPFKANAFKGSFSTIASVNFGANPLQLSINPTLNKVDLGDVLSQVLDIKRLTGVGNLDLNMKTQGIEVKQMLQNLSGTGSINLSDGALLGLDLNKVIESGLSLELLEGKKAYAGKTVFMGFNGDVKADKGLIQMNNLALVSPLFDLKGSAATDANKESLNGNFQLVLKGSLKTMLEQKYPQLKDSALPFELKGTWEQPRPMIDVESLLKAKFKGEVDAKVEKKKEELKNKLEDKLKDKLKNKLKF